jgi:hypothetical protein
VREREIERDTQERERQRDRERSTYIRFGVSGVCKSRAPEMKSVDVSKLQAGAVVRRV